MSNTKIFNDNILTAKVKLNPRNVNKNYQRYLALSIGLLAILGVTRYKLLSKN